MMLGIEALMRGGRKTVSGRVFYRPLTEWRGASDHGSAAEQQTDHKQHQEDEEEDFRYADSARRDPTEAEDRRYDRDDQENPSVPEHCFYLLP